MQPINDCSQQSAVFSASLEQNVPNPFTIQQRSVILCRRHFSSAKIIITDKNGAQLKQLNLSSAGKGTVHVDASTLASGAYNYSLYIDGRLIDPNKWYTAK